MGCQKTLTKPTLESQIFFGLLGGIVGFALLGMVPMLSATIPAVKSMLPDTLMCYFLVAGGIGAAFGIFFGGKYGDSRLGS